MNSEPLGFASFWAICHLLRIMVNRGLVSPNEVDEIYGSLIEGVQGVDPEFAVTLEERLTPLFAEMKKWAEERWIGKGKTNPR